LGTVQGRSLDGVLLQSELCLDVTLEGTKTLPSVYRLDLTTFSMQGLITLSWGELPVRYQAVVTTLRSVRVLASA
jgi:hypothetical protein